jgi:hypothetical protein
LRKILPLDEVVVIEVQARLGAVRILAKDIDALLLREVFESAGRSDRIHNRR